MMKSILLLVLLKTSAVYAKPLIDRCKLYMSRHFLSAPAPSLDLSEKQMEQFFFNAYTMAARANLNSASFLKEYKRVNAYQVIKIILNNNPGLSLKLRISMLAEEVYWGRFGPLILMDLLETKPEPKVQKQIVLSAAKMHFQHQNRLKKIREKSKSAADGMSFKSSDFFKEDNNNELLRMRMRVFEMLLEENPPPEVQRIIAYAVGQIQHPAGINILEMILRKNPLLDVQAEAAHSAGFIESAKGVSVLIMILQNNPSSQTLQSVVIQAIERIGVEGLPVLEVMLEQHPHYEISLKTAYYAGLFSGPSAGAFMLSKILKHNSFSFLERQEVITAYFKGRKVKLELHHSADNSGRTHDEGGGNFEFPPFKLAVF